MRQVWVPGLCVAAVVLAGGARAELKQEELTFQGPSRSGPVTVKADLFLPDGAGRLPAMIIHHGSAGVSNAREYAYAREFSAMGVASIIPDSFTARGVKSTTTDQSTVSANDMIADAFAALKVAAAHPRIDPARIGIVGFSKGGTVAMRSALAYVAQLNGPDGPRFVLHAPFYPACDQIPQNAAGTGAPVLPQIGAADTYVSPQSCIELAAKMKAAGIAIESIIYDGAPHGFDGVGPAYSIANGENHSRCVYEEQPDRSWVERTSGIATFGPGGRPVEGAGAKALAVCRTLGVSGGPNAEAKAKSLAALKAAMRVALKLN
jgi:dienelactone hydrolase